MLLGAGIRRPVANFRLPVSGCQFPASGVWLPMFGFWLPASGLNAPNLVAVYGDAALAIEVNDYIYYIAHIYALEVE